MEGLNVDWGFSFAMMEVMTVGGRMVDTRVARWVEEEVVVVGERREVWATERTSCMMLASSERADGMERTVPMF